MQPNVEAKMRLECLRVAEACASPDKGIDPDWVIRTAAKFYRYVADGEMGAEVTLKVVR